MKVGIDLGGTKLLMLAESPAGRSVSRLPTGSAFGPAELEAAVTGFVASLPATPSALGIAFPGLVDADGSVVACDVIPRLVGWRPPRALSGPWPFAILNDCEAALVAEARDHDRAATLAVVVVGTGIGAAFQVDGRVLRGARGWAGELGSIPIAAGDAVRTLDQLASGQAILEQAGCDGAELEALVARGDTRVMTVIRDAGAALGLGLAAVVHLLNPSALALGGGVLRLPGYAEAARSSGRAHTLGPMWETCAVGPLHDGEHAAAVGAALAASSSMDGPRQESS
jgi:predicted NBD/HSP70 family sugar kinase